MSSLCATIGCVNKRLFAQTSNGLPPVNKEVHEGKNKNNPAMA